MINIKPELPARTGERRTETAMDGDRVVEITNAGRPAWLAREAPLQLSAITYDLRDAHVFVKWWEARDAVSRLQCGYPQWQCRSVDYNYDYIMHFALHITEVGNSLEKLSNRLPLLGLR